MSQQALDIVLYGTVGCHLCDEARDLLDVVLSSKFESLEYPQVDIAEDEALYERYGERIPVLRASKTEQELNWPFEAQQVLKFLQNNAI